MSSTRNSSRSSVGGLPLRPRSRPRPAAARGHAATGSITALPAPEDIVVPGASTLNEEEVELLSELVHPHHHAAEATLVGDGAPGEDQGEEDEDEDEDERAWMERRQWWKRPSPLW